MQVLVINSGSSSIKFRCYDMRQETLLVAGLLERIGEAGSTCTSKEYRAAATATEHRDTLPIADHAAGLEHIFAMLERSDTPASLASLQAIGHRVAHGGETFQAPVRIDAGVVAGIRQMIPLAPLHNPAHLTGIEAAQRLCPQLPQVAVFDTNFARTLPPVAYRYAVPDELYQQHQVRRYGFHGTSHQHVARRAAECLDEPLENLRLITLHLGNGASAAAIEHGVCIDTSMGMTPLEGLIMGTRCGDLDPSVPFYLARTLGIGLDEIEALLNQRSGMKGLCGVGDMREVHRLADASDARAQLALEMYCYRISKYVGAYFTVLGGVDALVFTAGIGENDHRVRAAVCTRLAALGVALDDPRNRNSDASAAIISRPDSDVKVLVIPTNEELEIARETIATLGKTDAS